MDHGLQPPYPTPPATSSGPFRHPRPAEPTPYDRWRQDAYLRVAALRAAVEHYNGRPGVTADDVLDAAIAFRSFLTEGHEDGS